MLTSIDTGPLALGFVREASVVGTGVFVFVVFDVAGFEVVTGFAVAAGTCVAVVVGAAVVAGAAVAGTAVAGAVVSGAVVTGALVATGAVVGAEVVGALDGIGGNTSEGGGAVEEALSCAVAVSMVPASTDVLRRRTPRSDERKRRALERTSRDEVFTS